VNTGNAHQTKEARRVESASFLRGYARGALGAIRDCREDTERLLRKCGARQREPAGLPSSVRNGKGHREFIRNLSPTGAWNDGPSFHPRGYCDDIPARRMRPEYQTQRVLWRTQRP
jgi:hypothetical protein